jgi:hypothetical protein
MLRNELFYLPQTLFKEVHFPTDASEHGELHKKKASKLKGKLKKNPVNLPKHGDIDNNLIFYYPNMGSNISITIQKSISTDTATLEARAQPIRRTAEMEANRIEAEKKVDIQGDIRDMLRKIYPKENTDITDQMILRVGLLITDEYENEQLLDFSGIDGDMAKFAAVVAPFLAKVTGGNK